MFKKKDKKEIFDDEIVISKIKKGTKRKIKSKIRNEYFIDAHDTVKDKDIQSKVTQMLDDLADFEPIIDENKEKVFFDVDPNKFPFTKEEVFGIGEEDTEEVQTDIPVIARKKGSLEKFFEQDKKKLKKLKDKEKKPKLLKRRKKEPKIDFTDAKEESYYKFGKRKFVKVEDFISFLTQNYFEIEDIAKLVLRDEKFHGWISKKSGIYSDAFQEFKDIKTKIEK